MTASQRRQGIGRGLMAALEAKAEETGASSMIVLTDAKNEAALEVYRGLGYQGFAIALQKWLCEKGPYRVGDG